MRPPEGRAHTRNPASQKRAVFTPRNFLGRSLRVDIAKKLRGVKTVRFCDAVFFRYINPLG